MIFPGRHDSHDEHESKRKEPAKLDRWLVGLLAGAALMYLTGRVLGLGKAQPARLPSGQNPRASER